jgi:hypothetical protein
VLAHWGTAFLSAYKHILNLQCVNLLQFTQWKQLQLNEKQLNALESESESVILFATKLTLLTKFLMQEYNNELDNAE